MVSNMASSVGIPVMLNGWNVCTVHNVGVAAVEVCPMVALLTVITPYCPFCDTFICPPV